MQKIIVTGGAGYIGSHTVVELYKNGFVPIIIDNLSNTSIKNIEGLNSLLNFDVKWYNVDCADLDLMENIFKIEKKIFGCIHFAAYKSVEESVREPEKYFKNNIGSLNTLLQCMRKYNINNLIFSSSCTVYGMPERLPVSESAPFGKAESPYGETKQKCEDILFKSDIKSLSLRYFNPIGSHSSYLIGDCSSDKASNLVPIITEVAIGKRKKIIVNGNDYNTHDGTCIRDYIHVEDLANAHVKSIIYLANKKNGSYFFNVGSGSGYSVMDIIKTFEKVNNVEVNYSIGPRRKGDVEKIFSDNTKIFHNIGWEAKKNLNIALIDSWNWELNKKNA